MSDQADYETITAELLEKEGRVQDGTFQFDAGWQCNLPENDCFPFWKTTALPGFAPVSEVGGTKTVSSWRRLKTILVRSVTVPEIKEFIIPEETETRKVVSILNIYRVHVLKRAGHQDVISMDLEPGDTSDFVKATTQHGNGVNWVKKYLNREPDEVVTVDEHGKLSINHFKMDT